MILWKILCISNIIFNCFCSVVIGMVINKVAKQNKIKNAIPVRKR